MKASEFIIEAGEPKNPSRRGFLKGMAGVAASAAMPGGIGNLTKSVAAPSVVAPATAAASQANIMTQLFRTAVSAGIETVFAADEAKEEGTWNKQLEKVQGEKGKMPWGDNYSFGKSSGGTPYLITSNDYHTTWSFMDGGKPNSFVMVFDDSGNREVESTSNLKYANRLEKVDPEDYGINNVIDIILGEKITAADDYDYDWDDYDNVKQREAAIKDPDKASEYAFYDIGGRWPEAEPVIMRDPRSAGDYATNVIGGRWPEAEPVIMRDPESAYEYARYVLKARWPEAEFYIMQDPTQAKLYEKYFKIKGKLANLHAMDVARLMQLAGMGQQVGLGPKDLMRLYKLYKNTQDNLPPTNKSKELPTAAPTKALPAPTKANVLEPKLKQKHGDVWANYLQRTKSDEPQQVKPQSALPAPEKPNTLEPNLKQKQAVPVKKDTK